MPKVNFEQLLDAGVHFGHLKRKWNPAMAPYIFMEKNGIHIIDLQKTAIKLEEACSALKQIAKSGRKILFVATKKQAKDIVAEKVKRVNMPFVTERWPGGMLTNFPTIRKAVKKMSSIDKMSTDGTFDNLSKREKLQVNRQRAKLEKNLGSIADLTRLPAALFIVDVTKEHIAVKEARRLSIPVFAMVDTNSNPNIIDFPIPANDDASKSISLIIEMVTASIEEGLQERKFEKDSEPQRDKKSRKGEVEDLDEEELEEADEIEEETTESEAGTEISADETSLNIPSEIEGALLDGDIEPVVDAAKKVKLAKKAAPAKKIVIKKTKKDEES
jgi:small subunit ribosomal protein S2